MTIRRHVRVTTSLGEVTLAAHGNALAGVYFSDHRRPATPRGFGSVTESGRDVLLDDAAAQLREYLAGRRRAFALPVLTRGDEFQERVWSALSGVPYGETITYGQLAAQLGDPSQAREVGQALGRNPLCVVIPCHRVVGADGALTGYAGGLHRKRLLLDLEAPAQQLF